MIVKKTLLVPIVFCLSLVPGIHAMEDNAVTYNQEVMEMEATDTAQDAQEKNIFVQVCVNKDEPLFIVEMSRKTVSLSQTLENALTGSDEDTNEDGNVITITITDNHNFSPLALKVVLMLMQELGHTNSPSLLIYAVSRLEKESDLLELINAAAYLSCKPLHDLLITSIMKHLRSTIHDVESLYEALIITDIIDSNHAIDPCHAQSPYQNYIINILKPELTIDAHTDKISEIAYSSDGTLFATSSWDGTIKLWDAQSKSLLKEFIGHKGCILSLAFSSDNKKIVSGCDKQIIKIWDIETTKCITTIKDKEGLLSSVQFCPNNTNCIVYSSKESIIVYPIYTEDKYFELNGHEKEITQVIFSPSGAYLASASSDTTIKLWDTKAYACIYTFKDHEAEINKICFSADEKKLISANNNGIIKIWDIASKACLHTIQAHSTNINALALHDTIIISSSPNDFIKFWDLDSGELLHLYNTSNAINTLCVSPQGTQCILGFSDNMIGIYSFHNISKEFSLSTLLLLEYLLEARRQGKKVTLPTENFQALFSQLPVTFQQMFHNVIAQKSCNTQSVLKTINFTTY